MKEIVKEYSKDDITIVWDSNKCQHAAECVKNSPKVFNSKLRPWINIDGAETEEIINTIDKCPSGALSYKKK